MWVNAMGEDTNGLRSDEQSVSPVIGVILMVAITVILAAVVGVFATGIGGELNKVSGNVGVDFEESPVGLEMTVETVSTNADVRINGETIATIDEDDTGRTVLLPTAPGDRVTVVSGNDQQSVLVDKKIDERDEIGDFIAYWEFDDGSDPNTLTDQSGNGNDATVVEGSPTFGDGFVEFDGNDKFKVQDLDAPVTVSEFTIAITFTIDLSANTRMDAWEHNGPGTELGLVMFPDSSDYEHTPRVTFNGNTGFNKIDGATQSSDGQHTYIVTADEDEMALYKEGELIASGGSPGDIDMQDINIGAEVGGDHFEGKEYEMRMYYTAFDESEVESLETVIEE